MLIRYELPVQGKRERMCKTDEAVVSRIRAPGSPYDGMVERLQGVKTPNSEEIQKFRVRYSDRSGDLISIQSQLDYHIGKFLAMRMAGSIFPDHFVDASQMRVFKKKGQTFCSTYSGFVADEGGVIGRRKDAMRRFNRLRDSLGRRNAPNEEWDKLLEEFVRKEDSKERTFNPEIADLAEGDRKKRLRNSPSDRQLSYLRRDDRILRIKRHRFRVCHAERPGSRSDPCD